MSFYDGFESRTPQPTSDPVGQISALSKYVEDGPLIDARGTDLRDSYSSSRLFEVFGSVDERRDIYDTTKAAVEFADENDTKAIVLIDRSIRPFYGGFKEYWQQTHEPSEKAPDIFFLDPEGFGGKMHKIKNIDAETIERDHPFLTQHKKNNVLLIDTCIHSGGSAEPIIDALKTAGFEDVKFGVVQLEKNRSKTNPDVVLLGRHAVRGCYPLSRDNLVMHDGERLYSKVNPSISAVDQSIARRVRQEIRKIIAEPGISLIAESAEIRPIYDIWNSSSLLNVSSRGLRSKLFLKRLFSL